MEVVYTYQVCKSEKKETDLHYKKTYREKKKKNKYLTHERYTSRLYVAEWY